MFTSICVLQSIVSEVGRGVNRTFGCIALMGLATASLADSAAAQARGATKQQATSSAKPAAAAAKPAAPAPDGKQVFTTVCVACHQPNGEGLEDKYPPLVESEWVAGDEGRLIRIILHGLTGPVEVVGETFDGLMPPWGPTLGDPEIAAVATYVRSRFGKVTTPVTTAKVAAIRAATKTRTKPWTAEELAQVPAAK